MSASSRLLPWGAAVATALAFVAVVLLGASPVTRTDFPLDDAWIHLAYARGLLRDGLPTYNPAVPEAGFSSPLWLSFALAGLLVSQALGAPVALVVKAIAALLGAVAAAVLARCAHRAGASPVVAVVLSLAAPLGPWWCAGAASGMEVTLTALTLSLALDASLRDRPRTVGVFLALAVLARPECAAAVVALAAVAARPRRVVAVALPSLIAVALWVAYDLVVTGHPLPNTFYAKAGKADVARSVAFLAATLTEDGAVVALLLLGLAAIGLQRVRGAAPTWLALALVPLVGVLASRPLDPTVLLYTRRYLYPFLMLLWWPAALGAQHLVDALAQRSSAPPRWLTAMALLLAVVAVVPSVLAARALHADQCRDIATFHTAPARSLAVHTPVDAVVAVEGAGASRFFGGRTIVDLVGLNEHALIHHPRGSTAHLCHLLRVRRPTWFVLPSPWIARFAPAWDFTGYEVFRSDRYAQLEPPRRHEVLILRAVPRPEALARCGLVSGAAVAPPAPPSAP